MLLELRVENLLLIERAELRLAPGLNALTGETGAGKTVLAQALDLLLGGPAQPGRRGSGPARLVRPGSDAAYVEAVFAPPDELWPELVELLPDSAREDGEPRGELILARRVGADARSRCFLDGRAATLAQLRALGTRLISFYGQHEHRRLVLAGAQLQMLDSVCGERHAARLPECAASWRELRRLRGELERLQELERARERELDLLEHELAEIDDAAPEEAEHEQLLARRERLRAVESLRRAAGAAGDALEPSFDGLSPESAGAAHLLAGAASRLQAAGGVDAELDALAERAQALSIEAAELAGALRCYRELLDGEEGELQRIEERLAALERLLRKHGGTIASVREHGERARTRIQELSDAEREHGRTRARLEAEQAAFDAHVAELRGERERAAERLGAAVHDQLAALAMPDARFAIALSAAEPGPSGADAVEFLLAANPGVAAAPLREIASGGELSRAMLALAAACEDLNPVRPTPGRPLPPGSARRAPRSTLVFDEVDAGIGGHTARAVGERLRALAAGRQVICITHLPQIAALADRHFTVAKDTAGELTLATVTQLAEREVEGELMRMLGADADDAGAKRHARSLRRAA